MGEALPSEQYIYDEVWGDRRESRSTLTLDLWNRNDPYDGDDPRLNLTAEDHERQAIATAGLNLEQARALHRVLDRWIDANTQLTPHKQ
jgi:hypothetical protein